jgi:repressor LexA
LSLPGRTARQNAILRAIRDLTADGVPPSLDELARAVGLLGRGAIHGHLIALRDRGLIAWEPRRARSIRVLDPMPVTRELLDQLSDEQLRRVASWAHAILAGRGA